MLSLNIIYKQNFGEHVALNEHVALKSSFEKLIGQSNSFTMTGSIFCNQICELLIVPV